MHRMTVALATSAGLLTVLLSGCGVGEASTGGSVSDVQAPLPVEVVLPRKAEIVATYRTTSPVSSDVDAAVIARASGVVVEIHVEEGALVKKGQVLARLDGDRLRLEMQQAKANLEKTAREHDRFVNLHNRGLVSSAALDEMKYGMEEMQATFELKQLNYNYTFIRAPIAGVVSSRDIKIGQHVNSSDAAFRITDTTELVAHLRIPQSELSKFSPGLVASVQVDAMPERDFAATIARISPVIDSRDGTFRATAYLDNDGGFLAPGMFARFEIAYETHSDALLIPSDAVIQEDNESVVYVAENGEAIRRTITTGIEKNGSVEVVSGLQGDEHIIVTGQNGLRDGSKVLASVPAAAPVTG